MSITGKFLAIAKAGDPVYITDVRAAFATLPPGESFALALAVMRLDGGVQVFPLRLPRFLDGSGEERRFVADFFLAEVYNLLSCLGARSITLHCPGHEGEGRALLASFRECFGVELPTSRRQGYGKCLNVLERMLPAITPGVTPEDRHFRIAVSDGPAPAEAVPVVSMPEGGVATVVRKAAEDLSGKALLGVDIGGTDIKLVLALDGRIVCCKEFDWYPAGMVTAAEFVAPIMLLLRLMAWAGRAARDGDEAVLEIVRPVLDRTAGVPDMERAVRLAEETHGETALLFDAIGLSFPDVVVGNKIVGGETLKTRGMRDHLGDAYDGEFAVLTHLDKMIGAFVREGGAVGIINDGPMAAFTAGVEAAVNSPDDVRNGVFAHTLGTELGSGWVTETGAFPDIPLEIYNFIIDLGSFPEREFEPDDVRSLNNFNTLLPGTLQKIASQSGVFRLAFKFLAGVRPDLLERIRENGYVIERNGGLYVPTSPCDMRKPFLEFMMQLVDSENDPALDRIFEEIGVALAVTGREVDRLLAPAAHRRILFGRLVKHASCFELMRRGAATYDPDTELAVADESIAETPLMRDLGLSEEYTIAQFAQAVGAVYFANYTARCAKM